MTIRSFGAIALALAVTVAPLSAQNKRAQARMDSARKAATGKAGGDTTAPKPGSMAPGGSAVSQGASQPAPAQGQGTAQRPAPRDARLQMTLDREVFSYSAGGRRDPMISLMNTSLIRPLFTEVQLIAISYDEEGSNHMAVLRNTVDKAHTLYRVKVGQMLGRMKVTQITRTDVVFTLDEFGFSRQERLSMKPDTTAKRTP